MLKRSLCKDGSRSKKGFFLFIKNHYSKKNGSGRAISFEKNWSNLVKFIYKMNLSEEGLHQLTNVEMYQLLCYHRDLEKNCKDFRPIQIAAESYYQYIRYTIGCF